MKCSSPLSADSTATTITRESIARSRREVRRYGGSGIRFQQPWSPSARMNQWWQRSYTLRRVTTNALWPSDWKHCSICHPKLPRALDLRREGCTLTACTRIFCRRSVERARELASQLRARSGSGCDDRGWNCLSSG